MIGTVIIFAKVPIYGQVKTRLGRDIGASAATWWYRHQTAALIRRIGQDPRWRTVLSVAPDHAGQVSRLLPPNIDRWRQGDGDLGQRMARALSRPRGPVLLIGSDIPGVTRDILARAFQVLRGTDAVLGPATDGGFWLIGLNRRAGPLPRTLFRGVRWSGPDAMADTVTTLRPLRVDYAATLTDVDTADDLRRRA